MIGVIEHALLAELRASGLLRAARTDISNLIGNAKHDKEKPLSCTHPPWALLHMVEERQIALRPNLIRELHWDLRLGFLCLDVERSGAEAQRIVGALRDRFSGWQPSVNGKPLAGVEPAEVRLVRCEGLRTGVIIWLLRIVFLTYPSLGNQGEYCA